MQGKFDYSLVSKIQQANNIVEIIGEHLSLTKKGKEMVGLCPFHSDHKPSLYVNPVKQIFKCFACGAGGDVIKFIQLRENLTFPQTLERLANRAGIPIKKLPPGKSASSSDAQKLTKVNAWAAKLWQDNLYEKQAGAAVRKYISERKITDEIAKKWQLGFARDSWDNLINAIPKTADPQLLVKAGLIVERENAEGFYDKFRNRLMFPITDVNNRVIGFGGRTLGNDPAKYMNSPATVLFDKSNSLYGLNQARHKIVESGTAVVVEGYTDCIMAHQHGCENVVAALGTSFTSGHARILKRYAKKIVLVFDSDIAGVEAANRALEICLTEHIDIKLASVPQGKDPCDFLLTSGKEKFDQLIADATDVFDFKWQRLTEQFEKSDNLTDTRTATEEFLQTVATAMRAGTINAIDKGLMINRLSKVIGLTTNEINAELAKRTRRLAAAANQQQENIALDLGRGVGAAAQRQILEVLLNEPALFRAIKKRIKLEMFDVPVLAKIAKILFEKLDEDINSSLAQILTLVESPNLSSVITDLAQYGKEKGNFQTSLNGASEALIDYHGSQRKNTKKTKLTEIEILKRINENQISAKQGKTNPIRGFKF